MWQSLRISHLLLRLSLALVFLWFGIDKFFHPVYWLSMHIPQGLLHALGIFHISPDAVVYGMGVIELLIGISLVSNMFVDLFASVGIILLISSTFFYGFNEAVIRNISLMGVLVALVFWPSRSFRNY